MSTASKKPHGLETPVVDLDPGDDLPVGVEGILAASHKLLAINRGEAQPDERDALYFKRVYSVPKMMAERVGLDATGIFRKTMRAVAKQRSLKPVGPNQFGDLIEDMITRHPLSSPLEEINPMHVVEQARRITHMGPGGIPGDDSITEESQAVSPSTFGFISPVEGPECFAGDSDVFTSSGWVNWPLVTTEHKLACLIDGRLEFHNPERLIEEQYDGELVGIDGDQFQLWVTPNHRLLYKHSWSGPKVATASAVFDRSILVPTNHLPYFGGTGLVNFVLPAIPIKGSTQKIFKPISMVTWAAFMGYWLAEGSLNFESRYGERHPSTALISKERSHKPEVWAEINATLEAMGLSAFSYNENSGDFHVPGKQLAFYLQQFGHAGDKFIPEYFFEEPVEVREALLHAFMTTDVRVNATHLTYVSTSLKLVEGVQRLMISLGYPTVIREEPDSREHVKSTNWCCCQLKKKWRGSTSNIDGATFTLWATKPYSGKVYCATVPGGFIFTRTGRGVGFWSGNSSRAGVDTRLAWGTRLGKDGRIYQRFKNKRTGHLEWVSARDLLGKTVTVDND